MQEVNLHYNKAQHSAIIAVHPLFFVDNNVREVGFDYLQRIPRSNQVNFGHDSQVSSGTTTDESSTNNNTLISTIATTFNADNSGGEHSNQAVQASTSAAANAEITNISEEPEFFNGEHATVESIGGSDDDYAEYLDDPFASVENNENDFHLQYDSDSGQSKACATNGEISDEDDNFGLDGSISIQNVNVSLEIDPIYDDDFRLYELFGDCGTHDFNVHAEDNNQGEEAEEAEERHAIVPTNAPANIEFLGDSAIVGQIVDNDANFNLDDPISIKNESVPLDSFDDNDFSSAELFGQVGTDAFDTLNAEDNNQGEERHAIASTSVSANMGISSTSEDMNLFCGDDAASNTVNNTKIVWSSTGRSDSSKRDESKTIYMPNFFDFMLILF